LRALEGAARTILRFRPKLAIAAYHTQEDLVQIPQYLAGLDLAMSLHRSLYELGFKKLCSLLEPRAEPGGSSLDNLGLVRE